MNNLNNVFLINVVFIDISLHQIVTLYREQDENSNIRRQRGSGGGGGGGGG